MEDVLTETPPPSRFFEDDLDNFAAPSPPLPSPFLLVSPNPNPNPNFELLIILISPSSLSLLSSIPSKTLIASLFLPELPLSSSSSNNNNNSPINIYALSSTTIAAAAGCHVSAERSKAVAKLLVRDLRAERILVLDSIKGENFRGRLGLEEEEEAMSFKLETKEARRIEKKGRVESLEYLGSGSLVEGLGAAVIGECEMRRRKGTMVVTWPATGRGVARVLKGLLMDLEVEFAVGESAADSTLAAAASSSWLDSDLYT